MFSSFSFKSLKTLPSLCIKFFIGKQTSTTTFTSHYQTFWTNLNSCTYKWYRFGGAITGDK